MDFEDRIIDYFDEMDLNFPVYHDTNAVGESFSLAALPGSVVEYEDMTGLQGKLFNYEIQAKVKLANREKAMSDLFKIADELPSLDDLPSLDGSYNFEEIRITNEAFFMESHDGFSYFRLHFRPLLEVNKERK